MTPDMLDRAASQTLEQSWDHLPAEGRPTLVPFRPKKRCAEGLLPWGYEVETTAASLFLVLPHQVKTPEPSPFARACGAQGETGRHSGPRGVD